MLCVMCNKNKTWAMQMVCLPCLCQIGADDEEEYVRVISIISAVSVRDMLENDLDTDSRRLVGMAEEIFEREVGGSSLH